MTKRGRPLLPLARALVGLWMAAGSLAVWLAGGDGGGLGWTWAAAVGSGAAAYVLVVAHVVRDIPVADPGPGVYRGRSAALLGGVLSALAILGCGPRSLPVVMIGLGVGATIVAQIIVPSGPSIGRGTPTPLRVRWAMLMVVAIVVAGLAMRTDWPDHAPGVWMLLSLFALVLPGLAFSQFLLSDRPLIERLLHAPAFSLGSLLIAVMWSDLLGVRIAMETTVAVGGAIGVGGLVMSLRESRDTEKE